jgi:hypothetical protein
MAGGISCRMGSDLISLWQFPHSTTSVSFWGSGSGAGGAGGSGTDFLTTGSGELVSISG